MKKQYLMYLGLALIVFLAVNVVIAPFLFLVLLPSFGIYKPSIDVFISPPLLNWTTVTLNIPLTKQVVITNNGAPISHLNMTYNATANLLLYKLTWNGEGLPLPSGQMLTANFTLTIKNIANPTQQQGFNIDIQIGDTG